MKARLITMDDFQYGSLTSVMWASGGHIPIGTIAFFDASSAPTGWLACNGATYNISAYPKLAAHYQSVHGSKNFYGGNGTTTFAVPDLRGEFLRGTGTNSHSGQGNGGSLGVHQDATKHTETAFSTGQSRSANISTDTQISTVITKLNADKTTNTTIRYSSGTNYTSTDLGVIYTSRPTNTSFLICVRAIDDDVAGHTFGLTEQKIGTWVNGSSMYELTVATGGSVPSGATELYRMGFTGYDVLWYTK